MESSTRKSAHWSFWVFASLALLWNLAGCANYLYQMGAESMEVFRDVEQAIISSRPAWATAGFAVGVFAGAVGGLLLLLRRSASFYAFIASLLGVLLTSAHTLSIDRDFSIGELVVIVELPVLVAGFFVWYSRIVTNKGWVH